MCVLLLKELEMVAMVRVKTKYAVLGGAEEALTSYTLLSASQTAPVFVASDNANQNDLWDGIRGAFPTSTSVVERNCEVLDPGTGLVTTVIPLDVPTNPTGGGSGTSMPPQCSEVISIRSDGAGPSNRGRFYLPAFDATQIDTDGLIPLGTRTPTIDAHVTYFDAIKAGSQFGLGIWSPTHLAFVLATKIDMGSVYDTQRRRRRSLVEARYQGVLA